MITICKGQVFFTSPHFQLHSRKDIRGYHANENHLKTVIAKLEQSSNVFLNKSRLAKNETADQAFTNWLVHHSESCINHLEFNRKKANKMVDLTFHGQNKGDRLRRGIPFLGEILGAITSVPSPSQWSDEQVLIHNLGQVVAGNRNQTHLLEHTVKDEAQAIKKIEKEFESLLKIEFKSSKSVAAHSFYLNSRNKLDYICEEGKKISENLISEAEIIQEIRSQARLNRPSIHLFPLKELYLKSRFYKQKEKVPIFGSEFEIEKLFAMCTAVTTIEKNIIYSIINVPVADFTFKFQIIDYPNFSQEDLDVISNIQKLALRPIDIFLCARAQNIMKVLSSKDLNMCQKTFNSQTYICTGRSIQYKNQNLALPCSQLPKSLVLELSSTTLLIKTNLKQLEITCGKEKPSKVLLNNTYSIIKAKSYCKVAANDFYIDKHHRDHLDEYLSQPFEVVQFNLDSSNTKVEALSSQSINLGKITESLRADTKKLNKDLKDNANMDQENGRRMAVLEESFQTHKTINWGLIAAVAGGICLTVLVLLCICYRKYRTNQNPITNVTIETNESMNRRGNEGKIGISQGEI